MTARAIAHLFLHGAVPLALAFGIWRDKVWRAFFILMAGMVIDLDHLLADPIFDPNRCSVGFHPLHTSPAVAAYAAMIAFKPTRIFGVGLMVHIVLDGIDCVWMTLSATPF